MKAPFQFKTSPITALIFILFFLSADLSAQNCNNVTDGGSICCSQSSNISPYDPEPIISTQPATGGGNTAIEYMWMYTNDPFNTVFSTWNGAPNSNSASYDPGPLTTTTFFVRCARRAGCADFVSESNVVVITIAPCDILKSGGKIAADQSACGSPYDPSTLYSIAPASGGPSNAPIQYSWYKSNVFELFNLSTGNWSIIPGAAGDSHDPDAVNQTTYFVRVASRDGCPTWFASNILKVELFPAVKTEAVVKNPLCNGDSNGSIALTITGGTGPFVLAWADPSVPPNTFTLSGLKAGIYSYTITDANACQEIKQLELKEPLPLQISATGNDISCYGNNNGSVSVLATGGTVPYSYLWSGNHTTLSVTGLAPGIYRVTVTDANGCSKFAQVSITEPPLLAVSVGHLDLTCYSSADGVAAATPSGGVSPYTYLWSNGQTDAILTGLAAGTYSVTVGDQNNCLVSASLEILQPDSFNIKSVVVNNKCFGNTQGSVSVSVSGGTGAYDYSWSNGSKNAFISALPAGSYSLTINDGNGCSAVRNYIVTEPGRLEIAINSVSVTCNGEKDGAATVTIQGGTAPYSILWSNGSTSASISNLKSGNYIVIVADANLCSVESTVVIVEPAPLQIVAGGSNISCYEEQTGSVAVIVQSGGVLPFTYLWSNGATTSSQTGVLPSGNYSVTVTDANGCTALAVAIVTQNPELLISTSAVNVKCRGQKNGSATVNAIGGSGLYTYLWSGGETSSTIDNIGAGTYTITVTDTNGCSKSIAVTILQPDGFSVTVYSKAPSCHNGQNGNASAVISGSPAGMVSILWSSGDTGYAVNNLIAGSYNVTATDQNGCTATADFVLNNPSRIDFDVIASNIPCWGNGKGSASVLNVIGGQSPYTFMWSEGSTTSSVSQLTEGKYFVTVSDVNGCGEVKFIVITQPTALVCEAVISAPVTTYNGNQASATVTVTGGVQPYTYLWSDGETTASISGLTSGIYVVVVTDANGCTCTSLVKIPNKSRMGNFVWDDINADGIQQFSEPGIANVNVTLSGNMFNGTPVMLTQQTDASGYYLFDGLMAGNYKLTFEKPNGYYSTMQDIGADDKDSDVDTATGMSNNYVLADGESNLTVDAGFVKAGRIGDKVWFDKNKNGFQDNGESGFANIAVKLYLPGPDNIFQTADDLPVESTSTDNFGMYYFNDIVPGLKYKVRFDINSVPAGFVLTTANVGSDDNLDSDADADGFSHVVMLMPNQQEDLSIDAGLFVSCNNVDEGGIIGPREQNICGPAVVSPFISYSPASGGGSTPIEYLWMKSTTNPFFVPNSSDWMPVPNSNTAALAPGLISVTTYFIRCARRQGCDPYTAESNIVTVFVNPLPKAEISLYPKLDVCVMTGVDFAAADAGAGAMYSWNFGSNSIPQVATGISTSAFFNAIGTYRITLTVTKTGCSAQTFVDMNVVNCPGAGSRFGFADFKMTTVGYEKVALSWRTTDIRYDHIFIVEHSKNGVDFTRIGDVKARDLRNSGFYTFDDFNPSLGYNYYRIRHLDYFDSSVYSEKLNNFLTIAEVSMEAAVYPNPVTDFVKIEISKNRNKGATLDVLSPYGQVLFTSDIQNGQVMKELDVSDLPTGCYFIRINFGNDSFETHKIIVQQK